MAVYLDTTLLVPLFFHETASDSVCLHIALLARDKRQTGGCHFQGVRHEYIGR